jgi:uncharacterized protein with ATP-grasp and redox domains
MNPYPDCCPCMLKWIFERIAGPLGDSERFAVMRKVMSVLAGRFEPSVNLAALCNRCLEAVQEFFPPSSAAYQQFKEQCNRAASALLVDARAFIEKGKTRRDRFARACSIASLANVSPMGAVSEPFDFSHLEDVIKGERSLPPIQGEPSEAVSKAHRVLYVADNAGEFGFDSLLISLLKESGLKVTLIVKKEPFFDDAGMKDASYFGLDRIADDTLSSSKIFVPEEAPEQLAAAFSESDLIVSKGTGNFEALKGNTKGKTAIFLLKAKCRTVSEKTQVELGKFVVKVE